MYKETNKRSIVKGISWRAIATTTTIIIVYFFFGRLDLAIAAGMIETVLKIGLFWGHERIWHKVRWGQKKIDPFSLWFTGLPLSGKTTIADKVYEELEKLHMPIERIDSKDIRELIPDIGFSREDRNRHLKRIGHLIKTLQNNSISTVASFVSPYQESREGISKMVENNIIIYIKTDVETCKTRDVDGKYEKAIKGEYKNFTGVNDIYEEPKNADIVVETAITGVEEAADLIVKFVKKKYIK
jgi:adenylylsulfate kinase